MIQPEASPRKRKSCGDTPPDAERRRAVSGHHLAACAGWLLVGKKGEYAPFRQSHVGPVNMPGRYIGPYPYEWFEPFEVRSSLEPMPRSTAHSISTRAVSF